MSVRDLKVYIRTDFICEYEDVCVIALFVDDKFSKLITIKV